MTLMPSVSSAASWAEASDGEFSGAFASPSDIGFLALGSNVISGTSTAGATLVVLPNNAPHFPDQDVDVFSFSISPGQRLDSIVLSSFSYDVSEGHLGGATGDGAFMAIEQGAGITDPISAAALLGTALVGFLPGASQGDDVLAVLGGVPLGGIGLSGSLGPGQYTVWYQEGPTNTS